MKLMIFLLSIFLTACSGSEATPTQEPNAIMATQGIITPTMTRVPAPTLNHAATIAIAQTQAESERQKAYAAQQEAINAQQTSVAAGVELARITAEYEAGKIVIAQITQAAYATSEAHVAETLIAKPTADAKLSTQQAIEVTRLANQAGLMTQVAEEPARIQQINNAVNIERFGWMDYFARVMTSIAMIVLAGGVLAILYMRTEPKKQTEEETPAPQIHYHKDESDGAYQLTRIDPSIPCSKEQLIALAEGIRWNGMSLGYNAWQSTIVHKCLKDMREFFVRNLMAREASGDQVFMLHVGDKWLDKVLELGDAPPPYACVTPSPDPESVPELTPLI